MTDDDDERGFETDMQINDGGMSFENEQFVCHVAKRAMAQMEPWEQFVFALHLRDVPLGLIAEMCGLTNEAISWTWGQAQSTVKRVAALELYAMGGV